MVFSSTIFLFLFLPVVLGLAWVAPRRLVNGVLLVASLLFYAWGEVFFVGVMVASILANYVFGIWVGRQRDQRKAKLILTGAVAANLGLLFVYKYASFVVGNLNRVLASFDVAPLDWQPIHLPIGISFFTFQALSYVVDVYRREVKVQRSFLDLALYISLFPQLIAGPIVRYQDVEGQLTGRRVTLDKMAYGVRRFVLGLAKKVLIANAVAVAVDEIHALPASQLTPALAWLAALCYVLQIYFDFSGYSDMAIGLGSLLGFHFSENFLFPYAARSVREFWNRWHVSLSTWFRDYVYIPMGGNRCSPGRMYFNLVSVFLLCGAWHGANWTFIFWGAYQGTFLALERQSWLAGLGRAWTPIKHVYTLMVWLVGMVFFRADSIGDASVFVRRMVGLGDWSASWHTLDMHLTRDLCLLIPAAALCSVPLHRPLRAWYERRTAALGGGQRVLVEGASTLLGAGALTLLLVVCASFLAAGTHNPFIYFQF
jgi:alginate O-acetyltransferase complex protein AlgI